MGFAASNRIDLSPIMYVWGKYNWRKLLEDIYENKPGHYLGSVVCVHEKNETTPTEQLIY